ncbi:MAG: tRNA dihydrouridine(20/20a) synthase DusA [Myxococcales bacterium]|nr:tRNA dihydrouridine(20/20a) synthase DusA [Myxococcales bacterium]
MLSVAPMMDVTDRHFRWILRRITRCTLLYTEMVVDRAVLHGDRDRLLGFDPSEHPLVLQLGGDEPESLATCAQIAEDLGYDEVNLNVGCPSARVQSGRFGVVLMRTPERVADVVAAMRARVRIPVTVKHRIGLDDLDRYEDMLHFVDTVAQAGPARFTVHARKAWTKGLSPKQNRNVPPLRHDEIHRLKRERPQLCIETNGGVRTLVEVRDHLAHVDAVMIGRGARDDPYLFAHADQVVFGESHPVVPREDVARAAMDYARAQMAGPRFKVHHVTRHLLNLFAGQRGARAWKRTLSEQRHRGPEVIGSALEAVARSRSEAEAFSGSTP